MKAAIFAVLSLLQHDAKTLTIEAKQWYFRKMIPAAGAMYS
jgi:hypothetical protein